MSGRGRGRLPADARAIRGGDRQKLARAISAVEARDPRVLPVLRSLYPFTGVARVVGLTGPLGVGKSTLLNALIALLRSRGDRVGVVAIDPSSPYSGGSVLGDRIRIERPSGDDGLFFRSMASRGQAGGIAGAAREATRLLEAADYRTIFLETVGSGQVDVALRHVASTTVVVLVPHLGDEVQTLKAGLFEIADVFCVNKSDLPGADSAARDLSELVALGPPRAGWTPRIVRTSASTGAGVGELWDAIEAHERFLETPERKVALERSRLVQEILGLVQDRVGRELSVALAEDPALAGMIERVAERTLDPYTAADRLYRGRWRR